MTTPSNAPWVTIEPARANGLVWRCTVVHWLEPEINKDRHNVFIDAYVQGVAIRNGALSAMWGWKGQRDDEQSPPVKLDKKAPDPCGDIPIEKGQHIWLRIVGSEGYPSDIVRNLHAEMDGTGGNDWHHHSYYVRFDLSPDTSTPPQPPQPVDCAACQARVATLEAKLKAVTELVNSWQGD